jgi:uncharacterized protein YdeI (YjbR/CyaY-like superfamily)
LRNLVHAACPKVEETIKWGFPNFEYKGLMCNMAAFKQHCAFGFWKTRLMKDAKDMMGQNAYGMGHLGKIKSLSDLPADKKIKQWVWEAMKLNDDDVKLPERKGRKPATPLVIPPLLQKALLNNKTAATRFSNFSVSQRQEYIEWINEAKTEETLHKRIATTVLWVTEGKTRNWKYERKK